MKAWRFYSINDYRLEEVPVPEMKEGWVLVKPKVFQISVTEAACIRGIPTMGFKEFAQEVARNAPVQRLGHEFSGEVVECGKETTRLQVGDRVAVRHKTPCHRCKLCLSGREVDCRSGLVVGQDMPGCLAEFILLPEESLIKLPHSVDDHEAAALQPLSSCVAAVAKAKVELGDTIAILGQGVMGLNCMQLAKAAGGGKVITVDVREENVEMSKQLGADEVIHARKKDPIQSVLDFTDGSRVDMVFECAGGNVKQGLSGNTTLDQAVKMVRDGGKIIQIAFLEGKVEVDLMGFRKKGLHYLFPGVPTNKMWEYGVQAVAEKKVNIKPTIGNILKGLESFREAVELTTEKGRHQLINPPQVIV